jgi:hypothetical protein
MKFSLISKPKLNKDLILSKISEEQIFGFYLGDEFKSKKLFRSKLRRDNNPTCSLYRNNRGTLIYKDFATGQSLNCFGYVCELFHCTYSESLRIIANDFNIYKDDTLVRNKGKIISKDIKVEEKEFSKIQVEIQDFTSLELKWWSRYGITPEILKKFNVYSCKHVFLNGNVIASSQQHCPIFGYYGNKYHGEELWRCYFPKRKEYRFIGNWPTQKIQGIEHLPKKGNLLVITKSMKDTMVLYSLGIPACAPNSETQFISETVLESLKKRFKHIVVLFDNDLTGISFMNRIKKKHPELIYTWIPRKLNAKDISDYYKLNNKTKTINLIKQFLLWLSRKI